MATSQIQFFSITRFDILTDAGLQNIHECHVR